MLRKQHDLAKTLQSLGSDLEQFSETSPPVTAPDAISTCWGVNPRSRYVPRRTQSVSAAVFCEKDPVARDVFNEFADPTHILSVHLGQPFSVNMKLDGDPLFCGQAKPGSWSFVPCQQKARAQLRGPWTIFHLYIPDQLLGLALEEEGISQTSESFSTALAWKGKQFTPNRRIGRLGQQISGEINEQKAFSSLAIEGHGLELLAALLRHYGATAKSAAQKERLTQHQLRCIHDYILAHLKQDIAVDDLAAQLRLSKYHFSRAFKTSTGHTPFQRVTAIRMDQAKTFLRDLETPISDVAYRVGYSDQAHFARVFRRDCGCTPTSYRRQIM